MTHPTTPQPSDLSAQLDEARTMEEHYRGLMMFWKQRRQALERQIPDSYNDLFRQVKDVLDNLE